METPPDSSKKSLVNSVKKTCLTPCRRLGLYRPSCGSSKKTHLVRTLVCSIDKDKDHMLLQADKSVLASLDTSVCNENRSLGLLKDSVNDRTSNKKLRHVVLSPNVDLNPSSLYCKPNELFKQSDKNDVPPHNVSKKRRLNEENIDVQCKTSITVQKNNFYSSGDSSDLGLRNDLSLDESVKNVTAETIKHIVNSIKKKKNKLEELKVQETYSKKHDLAELRQQTEKWRMAGQEALRFSVNLARQASYSVTLKQLMSQHGFLPHLMGYNSEDDEFC